MIKDQRHIEAGDHNADMEGVRAGWQMVLRNPLFPGFSFHERVGERELLDDPDGLKLLAYVSDNRWVATCPRDGCNGGIMVTPGFPEAACFDCGYVYHKVVFPKKKDLVAATEVLLQRPVENRHWFPDQEDVADLKAENATRGFGFTTRGGVSNG